MKFRICPLAAQNRNTRRLSQGFTLIELLIVIAIIVLLAAILFPVFARARENARRSSCQSNLKQIGLAIMQYTQDYDERYMTTRYTSTTTIGHLGWAGKLYPYTKSGQIFKCPSDPTSPSSNFTPFSYGLNYNLTAEATNAKSSGNHAFLLSAMPSPVLTVLLFEVQGSLVDVTVEQERRSPTGNGAGRATDPAVLDGASPIIRWATGIFPNRPQVTVGTDKGNALDTNGRHLEGSNYLAADGHVKWYRPTSISAGSSACNANQVQSTNGSYSCGFAANLNAAGTESMEITAGGAKAALTFSPY